MKLTELPDVCLREIVKRLPPRDQLLVGMLCRRMYDIQQSVILAICQKKSSLRIDSAHIQLHTYALGDFAFYQLDNDHDLLVRWRKNRRRRLTPIQPVIISDEDESGNLRETTARYDFTITSREGLLALGKTYPNITHLSLVNFSCLKTNVDEVSLIFSNWPNLKCIKFIGIYDTEHLFKLLNQLNALKKLFIEFPLEDVAKFQFLPQLEELACHLEPSLGENTPPDMMVNQLVEHNTNLRSIGLWIGGFDDCKLAFSPNVISKLYRLTVRQPFKLSDLDWITTRFYNLTFFDFDLSLSHFYPTGATHTVFPDIVTRLSRLPNLSEVRMAIISDHCLNEELDSQVILNLPSLQSIKSVQVELKVDPHKLHLLKSVFPKADIVFSIPEYFFDDISPFMCKHSETNCRICRQIDLLMRKRVQHQARIILVNVNVINNGPLGQLEYMEYM